MATPAKHRDLTFAICAVLTLLLSVQVKAAPVALEYYSHAITVKGVERLVTVPKGYRLEIVSGELRGPRLISLGPHGELLIGSKSGQLYRLNVPYKEVEVLARVGGYPHSLAVRGNELLVARTDGVYAVGYASDKPLDTAPARTVARLPGGGGHNTRSVAVGPNGRIYVSLGITGNCSQQYLDESYAFDERRGGVLILDEEVEPAVWRPFASGLRNPVGFDWHPVTGVMYASNNGPDHLGYDVPPEYFSKLTPNSFHGMPWYQYDGEKLRRDPCIRSDPPLPLEQVSTPAATFAARNAPMGVAFVPDGAMDPGLVGDALVALRGSWGTAPSGSSSGDPSTRRVPKIVAVRFDEGEAARVDDLVTGFQLADGSRWARPVGVRIGADGALYFTSDEGLNALFRLARQP